MAALSALADTYLLLMSVPLAPAIVLFVIQ